LKDGDTFKALTVEGVEVTYKVISSSKNTCQIGVETEKQYGVEISTAVSPQTEGSVTIPEEVNGYRVMVVGIDAFHNCTNLKKINLPGSITEIGEDAFLGCSSLNDFSMPSHVKTIGSGAFSWCTSLESITIPSNVTSIGESAFQTCRSLKRIESEIREPFAITDYEFKCYDDETGDFLYSPIYTDATLYVPAGCKAKYEVTEGWKNFQNIVEMGE
jgi:hypothetical protein